MDSHGRAYIRADSVYLTVVTRKLDGQIWIYRVSGAQEIFYFRNLSASPSDPENWVITRWEDSPYARTRERADSLPPVVEETSWSSLKALYLYPARLRSPGLSSLESP